MAVFGHKKLWQPLALDILSMISEMYDNLLPQETLAASRCEYLLYDFSKDVVAFCQKSLWQSLAAMSMIPQKLWQQFATRNYGSVCEAEIVSL